MPPSRIPSEIQDKFVAFVKENGGPDAKYVLKGAKRVTFLEELQQLADKINFRLPKEEKGGTLVVKTSFINHQLSSAKAKLGQKNSKSKEYLKEKNDRNHAQKKAKLEKIKTDFIKDAKDTGVFTDEELEAKFHEINNLQREELGNRSIKEFVENAKEDKLSAYWGSTMSDEEYEVLAFLCKSSRNPIILHSDGRIISRPEARKDFNVKYIILYEDLNVHNVFNLEKMFHQHCFDKLDVTDGHRLYTHCGKGPKFEDIKGYGRLYFTYSTSLIPAIADGRLKINLARLRKEEHDKALQKRDAARDAAREEEIEMLKQKVALLEAMNQDSKPAALPSPPRKPSPKKQIASSPRKPSAKKQKPSSMDPKSRNLTSLSKVDKKGMKKMQSFFQKK